MSEVETDFSKPLAFFFQETEFESAAVTKVLERLDLRVERFMDPRAFLLQIRRNDAGLCFIDASTPKSDISLAVLKTIASFFGKNVPVLVLVRKGDQAMIDKVLAMGARAAVEKPLQLRDLARKLSSYVVTNAIFEQVGKFPPDKNVASSVYAAASAPPPTPPVATEPPIVKVPIPKLVNWHFEKILPVLAELSSSLETFEDIEDQLKFYADRLVTKHVQIEKMVSTLRRSEEKIDLLQSLRMYGGTNSRNLVAAFALGNATKTELIGFNAKNSLLTAEPQKVIPYAAKGVEHFGEGSRFQQQAFNAGLVFDLLALIIDGTGERKRPLTKFLQLCYATGMKKSDKGFSLGKQVSDLAMDRHIISTLMMREAGRVVMAIFYEDYMDVFARFEKKGVKPVLQHVVEQKYYSVSHNLIGALLCQATPGLGPAYKAVLFCDYPFMLHANKSDADSYALARLCQSL